MIPSDAVIAAHQQIPISVARKWTRAFPMYGDELESVGRYALVVAARAFDPTRGVPFPAYAIPVITRALIDEIRRWRGKPGVRARHVSAERHGWRLRDPRPSVEACLIAREQAGRRLAAMAHLSRADRALIAARLRGLTLQTIGDQQDRSVGWVHGQLVRIGEQVRADVA